MRRTAQKLPAEEVEQVQNSPQQTGRRFWDWARRIKDEVVDTGRLMKSVWDHPHITDEQWHIENARNVQQGRKRKPSWLELAKMSPKIRRLYTR